MRATAPSVYVPLATEAGIVTAADAEKVSSGNSGPFQTGAGEGRRLIAAPGVVPVGVRRMRVFTIGLGAVPPFPTV